MLTRAGHFARHDGAYLGYLSPRVALKRFDRPKVPTTTPYSWLMVMHARTIDNNAVPLKQATANLTFCLVWELVAATSRLDLRVISRILRASE